MRILLIQPPTPGRGLFNSIAMLEPLGLEEVGAAVSDHDVRILDLRFGESLDEILEEFRPRVVGVTAVTPEVYNAIRTVERVKEFDPNVFTVLGGKHASLCPKDFDRDPIDAVVIGEGEQTFPDLIESLEQNGELEEVCGLAVRRNGTLRLNRPREILPELDSSPWPARGLISEYAKEYFWLFKKPWVSIETSRGCSYRCRHCSVWKYHQGQCQYKSAQRVSKEIEAIAQDQIFICDDSFLQNPRRCKEIFDILRNSGIRKTFLIQARSDDISRHRNLIEDWREIGLRFVLVGLEAASDARLRKFNKNTSVKKNDEALSILYENDIVAIGNFMIDVDFSEDDFEGVSEYVATRPIAFPNYTVFTPTPGTDAYEDLFPLLKTRNYELFDFWHAVLPTLLPIEEFYFHFAQLYKKSLKHFKNVPDVFMRDQQDATIFHNLVATFKRLSKSSTYLQDEIAGISLSEGDERVRE
jgi:radical SAM superfamily enzyme YgiQ (UPF0313 family)